MTGSRGLRETVVRALAKVGLVWALVVLGAFFVGAGAVGPDSDHAGLTVPDVQVPNTAGLVLLLVVLASGATVLALGTARSEPGSERPVDDPASDLSLALALGLLP